MADQSDLIAEFKKHLGMAISSTVKAGTRFEDDDPDNNDEAEKWMLQAKGHRDNATQAMMAIIDARIEEAIAKLR